MALDVAEFLWAKFMRSLEEADELSGSTFIAYFTDIKNVVKEIDVVPEPYTYCDSIRLLYELNDTLAECRIFARECKKRNKKLLLFNPRTYYITHKMKNRLKEIKENLQKLAAAITLELDNLAVQREEQDNPPELVTVEGPMLSSKVLGFDKYEKKIEDLLFEGASSSGPGVTGIGVLGIAGVGKTTLVQKVLESKSVKSVFYPIVWIPFSGMMEEKEGIPKFIFDLRVLDKQGSSTIDTKIDDFSKLLGMLNQIVTDEKYLVVLDDVCHKTISFAERLCHGLSKGRDGRVIVTCRVAEIAENLVKQNQLLLVEPLDPETCWLIFQEGMKNDTEFSSNSADRETLKKIEKEIKYQCHGLPLAAKTLAEIIPRRIRDKRLLMQSTWDL